MLSWAALYQRARSAAAGARRPHFNPAPVARRRLQRVVRRLGHLTLIGRRQRCPGTHGETGDTPDRYPRRR